jgi:predicted ArsR family transcriptional regulator
VAPLHYFPERQRLILSRLDAAPPTGLTYGELAKDLHLSIGGVRNHLMVLIRDGLVISRLPRRSEGRPGRRSFRFSLAPSAGAVFGNNSSAVALELLDLVAGRSPWAVAQAFASFQDEQLLEVQKVAPGSPGPQAIGAAVQFLRGNGAEALPLVAEDGAEGVAVHHCPVASAAARFSEFCNIELACLKVLLGDTVRRTELVLTGDARCVYLVARAHHQQRDLGPEHSNSSSAGTAGSKPSRESAGSRGEHIAYRFTDVEA